MIAAPRLTDGHTLSATPPTVTSGLADMLVALGEARIAVTRAERDARIPGAYILTVSGEVDRAIGVLAGDGFTVHGRLAA